MTFVKGKSGNPSGRPPGIGWKHKLFTDKVMPKREELLQKAIDMALSGNERMLEFLLDKIAPKKVDQRPVNLHAEAEIVKENILTSVECNDINATEANKLLDLHHRCTSTAGVVDASSFDEKINLLLDIARTRAADDNKK